MLKIAEYLKNMLLFDYFTHIVEPQIDRAQALGISENEINTMWQKALVESEPATLGKTPGVLFSTAIDQWEREHP